ncbi:metallophosphoesterase family protein [Pendulispora albinea]|uniref:Metallophosphoesterase n=1 Tax=Pendulispora albinea TaxID=2741071 RepID=A0ABZ2M4P7_9BACT
MTTKRSGFKSVETKYMEERESLIRSLGKLDRRMFLKVSAAAAGAALGQGLVTPHSFQPVKVAYGQTGGQKGGFRFAYISDSHLYERKLNDRFVNALLRAVDDVNAMDPQPDFVFYGGDLAQLGQPKELELGAQILKNLKAPMRIMVGEHDWYFDLGEKWRELFGPPQYSFDHKGVHCVVLNSVVEKDFWTARKLSPMDRMKTVAGLDNGVQSPFSVGDEGRAWLQKDLAKVPATTPLIVFSHSPLYKLYKPWNFWTDDAEQVQALLRKFQNVTVFHGHTHQVLTNRIGNISFHGFLSTAWPWPYAPEGLPELTVQMGRPDPFNPQDGCGDGSVQVLAAGLADKVYNLWNRNPVTVRASYLTSRGNKDKPANAVLTSF